MWLGSPSKWTRFSAISGAWILNGLQTMHRWIFFVCGVCVTPSPGSFGQWIMIGDICPSIAIQNIHTRSFHQANHVPNRFPKHHAWSRRQRKRPLSRLLNRTLLIRHPSRPKKIVSDNRILPSLRSANFRNCGATRGRTFIEPCWCELQESASNFH